MAAPRWARGCSPRSRRSLRRSLACRCRPVRVSASDTSKVPNASPTAASSGSDMNGMAARDAARTLRERLAAFAARKFDCDPSIVEFANGIVTAAGKTLPFAELARDGVHGARPAVGHRLLRHAQDPLRSQDAHRPAVLLLRVRRGGVGGGDRHADRRASAAQGRHPARRRALAESGDRPRADRRRLHPGLRAGSRWRSCGGTTRAS